MPVLLLRIGNVVTSVQGPHVHRDREQLQQHGLRGLALLGQVEEFRVLELATDLASTRVEREPLQLDYQYIGDSEKSSLNDSFLFLAFVAAIVWTSFFAAKLFY